VTWRKPGRGPLVDSDGASDPGAIGLVPNYPQLGVFVRASDDVYVLCELWNRGDTDG
jgi:hypothetical protein